RIAVDDLPEFCERECAGKRRQHVDHAECAMGKVVFFPDVAGGNGNKECLAEGGEEGEQETAGEPAGIFAEEIEKGHRFLVGERRNAKPMPDSGRRRILCTHPQEARRSAAATPSFPCWRNTACMTDKSMLIYLHERV